MTFLKDVNGKTSHKRVSALVCLVCLVACTVVGLSTNNTIQSELLFTLGGIITGVAIAAPFEKPSPYANDSRPNI